MFGGMSYRTTRDRIEANEEVASRAGARSNLRRMRRRIVCAKASLAYELKCFKKAVRYIADNVRQKEQQIMFQAEPRQHLWRLKQFGVRGHQLAIRATVVLQPEEAQLVEEAITDQKHGMTRKLAMFIKQRKAEAEWCVRNS